MEQNRMEWNRLKRKKDKVEQNKGSIGMEWYRTEQIEKTERNKKKTEHKKEGKEKKGWDEMGWSETE